MTNGEMIAKIAAKLERIEREISMTRDEKNYAQKHGEMLSFEIAKNHLYALEEEQDRVYSIYLKMKAEATK